jgi:cell division protein FtsB
MHSIRRDRLASILLSSIEYRIERLASLRLAVHILQGSIMADKQAVLSEISALRDLITQDNLRDQQAMDQISAVNQSLRAQIVDLQKNHGTDPTDFDDILSQLDSVKTLIQPVNVNETLQNVSASAQSADTTSTAPTESAETPIAIETPAPESAAVLPASDQGSST